MEDEEEKTIDVAEKDDSSSSDDDEVADEGRDVFLGFAVEKEEGENDGDEADFPSTLGGRPYWPRSVALLRSEELFACPTCKQSMPLLAQVYAPLEWIEAAHHRFVMVFVCTRAACWRSRDCVLVLRSQLRKEEPPLDPGAERGLLCRVCGKPAFKACGKCHRQHYCCAAHQAADWRAGHKQHCGEPDEPPCAVGLAPHLLLRRMEIVSEREVYVYDKEQIEEAAASNSALMSQELRAKMLPPTAAESKMLQQSKKADSTFLRFVARTKEYQEQVLRYSFGARRPLWVNADNQLIGEPPKCERCGGRRAFELQLMPQLLFFLKVDSNEETAMDWNSLIVYVCEASCDAGETGYAKEYAFVH
jgi:pre-rRNA-processing protein TSR4